ncbi:MAG: hypothetical protein H6502_04415 [Candidatus Woesearchaeota archaeon]|nr:MAG: hypothetical protein H6502_04415 [Candidatus Woesearchaeota archaeon]
METKVELFKSFEGKEAILLLDARAVPLHGNGEQSLEARALVSKNQSLSASMLFVDRIEYALLSSNEFKEEKRVYGRGGIQKEYIIGIFEPAQE